MSSIRHPRAAIYYAVAILAPAALIVAVAILVPGVRRTIGGLMALVGPPRSVQDRLAEFAAEHRAHWSMRCGVVGIPYPPTSVTLLGLKAERRIDVHGAGPDGTFRFLGSIPVLGASGVAGPKLREGDGQVPEGVYAIASLNPNSRFHVSIRVDYPNDFDRTMAARDGRAAASVPLGGDIMIHGSDVSVGCLAVGDASAERLFTLVADTGLPRTRIVLAPLDLREHPRPNSASLPAWCGELYDSLDEELARLEPPAEGEP